MRADMAALLGEIINARKSRALSHKDLEELSGVEQTMISRIESGATDPQLGTVLKILQSLGKTLAVVDRAHSNNKALQNFLQFEPLTDDVHEAILEARRKDAEYAANPINDRKPMD